MQPKWWHVQCQVQVYTMDKKIELEFSLRTDRSLHCSVFCLTPENSPKGTYMNLTEEDEEDENEK